MIDRAKDIDAEYLSIKYKDYFVVDDDYIGIDLESNLPRQTIDDGDLQLLIAMKQILFITNQFRQVTHLSPIEDDRDGVQDRDWNWYLNNAVLQTLAVVVGAGTWFAFIAGTITAAAFSVSFGTILSMAFAAVVALVLAHPGIAAYVVFYAGWFIGSIISGLIQGKGVGIKVKTVFFNIIPVGIKFEVR